MTRIIRALQWTKQVARAMESRRLRTSNLVGVAFFLCPASSLTRQAYVVERFGKFSTVLDPGLNLIIPFVVSRMGRRGGVCGAYQSGERVR
jgi:hypothetical protein